MCRFSIFECTIGGTSMTIRCSLALAALLPASMLSQPSSGDRERVREAKLEAIMRIQDLRTPYDGKLVSLLTDSDPLVQERATLAYGSLQDTSIIGTLTQNLIEGTRQVQIAAAFAIGQTGTVLSPGGRQQLEYDLLWKRLDQTQAAERLIEEIGKFGTEEGLNHLLLRIGNSTPLLYAKGLIRSIARFGIRGITSADAVRYLLRFIRPTESTPWEVVYALQRIGDRPEIREEIPQLLLLKDHADPLVRMNLATLLGKLRDSPLCQDPLNRMSLFDQDWRVRVNALKALAGTLTAGKTPDAVSTFRRAFYDGNPSIAITALASLANAGIDARDTSAEIRETLRELRYLTVNSSDNIAWQIQAAACLSLAAIERKDAFPFLSLQSGPQPLLQAAMLRAAGLSGADAALEQLAMATLQSNPVIVCAALEGLQTLSHAHPGDSRVADTTYALLIRALGRDDVAIAATAASILGDSLFLKKSSVPALVSALSTFRLPDDVEAMQEVIATLEKISDAGSVPALLNQLKSSDRTVAAAAAGALQSITGIEYLSRLVQRSEPLFTDLDFAYLRSLPGTMTIQMETTKGTVTIALFKDVAPFTTMSFLKLATQRGFFRGRTFHRVVSNFVIQGGDPRGDGWGGPGYMLRSEFSPLKFETGSVGMASAGKDTEGSQFFITHSPQLHLEGRYTIFGRVTAGMEVVDRIQVDDRILDVKVITGAPVGR